MQTRNSRTGEVDEENTELSEQREEMSKKTEEMIISKQLLNLQKMNGERTRPDSGSPNGVASSSLGGLGEPRHVGPTSAFLTWEAWVGPENLHFQGL